MEVSKILVRIHFTTIREGQKRSKLNHKYRYTAGGSVRKKTTIMKLCLISISLVLSHLQSVLGFGRLNPPPHSLTLSPTQLQSRSSVDFCNQIDFSAQVEELAHLLSDVEADLDRVHDLTEQLHELEHEDPWLATATDEQVLVEAQRAILTLQSFERLLRQERSQLQEEV